jgi:Flp pilus assembly pilin Flp
MAERSRRLLRDDAGQDLVEYALLLAGVTIACIVAIQMLGSAVSTQYAGVASTLGAASGAGSGDGTPNDGAPTGGTPSGGNSGAGSGATGSGGGGTGGGSGTGGSGDTGGNGGSGGGSGGSDDDDKGTVEPRSEP